MTRHIAAWLHIGPRDDCPAEAQGDCGPPVGVQRLHVVDDLPADHRFARSHLATRIVSAIAAILDPTSFAAITATLRDGTGHEWHEVHALIMEALTAGGNFQLDIGGGMYATVYPAEHTSGVNLDHDSPREI